MMMMMIATFCCDVSSVWRQLT